MAKSKSQSVPIKYYIRGIEVVESKVLVDITYAINDKAKLRYFLDINYKLDASSGNIVITLSYTFADGETPLHKITTKNIFEVGKASIKSLNDEHIKQRFLIKLTELSLDHSRGIHAYLLKDTFLKRYHIPTIDPKVLGKIIEQEPED